MKEIATKKRKKKGFTLIELIIVIAVIGIIAAIAVPSLMGTKETFKIKADEKSAQTVSRAVELLVIDETIAPTASGSITITPSSTGATTVALDSNLEKDTTKAANIKKLLETSLQDLKIPQEKGVDSYLITLESGKVKSSTTTKKTVAVPPATQP